MMRPKVVIYGDVSVDGRLTISPDVLLLFGDKRGSVVVKKSDVYERLLKIHCSQAILEGSNSFVSGDAGAYPFPPYEGDSSLLYRDYLPEEILCKKWKGLFCVTDSRGRVGLTYTG